MVDEELVELLKTDVEAFNARGVSEPNLIGANLSRANLSRANLYRADLSGADVTGADLSYANLSGAHLLRTNLSGASLEWARLTVAKLSDANLTQANLHAADLSEARLANANLSGVSLVGAKLVGSYLGGANLDGADLTMATLAQTVFASVELRNTHGLEAADQLGPCFVDTSTLALSRGQIPEVFLRGCGLSRWEILMAQCYDPDMTPGRWANELDPQFFDERFRGPMFARGVFISYSHADARFADKLYAQFANNGCPCWLDRHDMVAGDMQQQIHRALRRQDVVVVVLSKDSIESDWVELELETARGLEKERGSDVLCPVALDDSWRAKTDGDVLWRQLRKKLVIDFSSWKTKAFSTAFDKLYRGVLTNYGQTDSGDD